MTFLVHKEINSILEKVNDEVGSIVTSSGTYPLYTKLNLESLRGLVEFTAVESALKYVELLNWIDKQVFFEELSPDVQAKILNAARYQLIKQEDLY